jgi:small subunit ribosomal protein S17
MAKTIIGTVSSNKTDKTIIVTVQTRKTHPLYKKQYTVSSKFMAHDEKNEAKVGDSVEITEIKPLSARKRHTLTRVIERALIGENETVEAVTTKEPIEKPVKAKKAVRPEAEEK